MYEINQIHKFMISTSIQQKQVGMKVDSTLKFIEKKLEHQFKRKFWIL